MKLRNSAVAAAAALVILPFGAQAALLTGKLDIAGNINRDNSTFAPGGFVDFHGQIGKATDATGDFASVNTIFETGDDTEFTLFDLDLNPGETVYEGGGFSFTVTSYHGFDNAQPGLAFMANGIINTTLAGFDPTPGFFELSTQGMARTVSFSSTTTPIPLPASVLMLVGALGGMAFIGRRRSA